MKSRTVSADVSFWWWWWIFFVGPVVLVLLLQVADTPTNAFVSNKRQIFPKKSTTDLKSIPNPLDTLTSGLASICRLPKGVTAIETPPTADGQLDLLPKFCLLWDIENSPDCRIVRELLTELDVVVDKVIPAATNSRVFVDPNYQYALPAAATIPRLEVEESNGEEYLLSGVEEITAYLINLKEQQRQLAKQQNGGVEEIDENEEEGDITALNVLKENALDLWAVVGNGLASLFRIGRGKKVTAAAAAVGSSATSSPSGGSGATTTAEVPRPAQPLVLYSYEGNQFCRLVREVLTELDIVYELRSAGKESPRRSELAYITGGSSQCPFLIDPNTGVDMAESKDIVEYLYKNYARWTPPDEILEWASGTVIPLFQPLFQTLAPLQAGSQQEDTAAYEVGMKQARDALDSTIQKNSVVVYTYEWSPFCTEATALLDSLEIPYEEVSLGKEWIPGLITPEGAQLRAALLEKTGQSSLPHVFIGGKSIGGLFSGTPGLVPTLNDGKLETMAQSAAEILQKRKLGAFE